MKEFLYESWFRLKLETPKYFKKLIWFGISLGVAGVAYGQLREAYPAYLDSLIPGWVDAIARQMVGAGVMCWLVARLVLKAEDYEEMKRRKAELEGRQ